MRTKCKSYFFPDDSTQVTLLFLPTKWNPSHPLLGREDFMIKLIRVSINKYKSIQKPQTIEIDPEITTIVGMNEAGKTSLLTAIAKTNYFNSDPDFNFDITQDYPRSELIDFQNQDEDCEILRC